MTVAATDPIALSSFETVRWCRGTKLLVAASVVWVVFLAAHLLLAGRWWLWSAVETMPPMVILLVPLVLLALAPLARPVRGKLVPLLLAALLAGVPFAGISFAVLTGGGNAENGVKVFSWNTEYWHMADDPGDFYSYLRAEDADVYLLQEYLFWDGGPVRIDDLARVRAAFPGYQVAQDSELITISRLPILTSRLLEVTDPDWRGSRILRTDIRVGGRVVSFYNSHFAVPIDLSLSPFSGEFYDYLHEQYVRRQDELAALRADLATNHNPVLVAGDFNSAWVANLLRLRDGVERRDPDTGSPLPLSWPGETIPLPRLWRLDWVFTTDDVRVEHYRFDADLGYSDHFAQELRISVT
ncbi:endonuclease/exonuclease/phosphatase family protein [Umezawaea sp. Da 62-37]|uniref:endonuclease/exonuclease/phosphatase family protein n=1 Tax=Umezawaea sp. Da 62-37 TaxID=3075927 RepID=UPI0028F6EA59|nr:endonuclease/exonuclease/phosphatase family protein [Umezawaea sp. Da 62-37]WNV87208.1 endonuclease/exonuclease/phosphatase family protein [Umezawaea sp. Da 62-37]